MSSHRKSPAPRPTDRARRTPLARALDAIEAGRADVARAVLLEAAASGAADAEVLVLLGKLLAEGGELARAEPWYRRAVERAPDDLVVRLALTDYLAACGRVGEAEDALAAVRRGLREPPEGDAVDDAEAAAERAAIARALAATERAVEELRSRPAAIGLALERMLTAAPIDFAALEATLARTDAALGRGWRRASPGIVEALGRARAAFGRAVMRGVVDRDACPSLLGRRVRRA